MGTLDTSQNKFTIDRDSLTSPMVDDFGTLEHAHIVQEILDSSPFISAVINNQQQIVLSNSKLSHFAAFAAIEQIIGNRPGKVLSCNNHETYSECGKGEKCKYCGILNTIKKSQQTNTLASDECRVTLYKNKKLEYHDFKITCSPLNVNNHTFTLLVLEDISHEKRKAVLENVFFHDVMNRLGGLTGIIRFIKSGNKQPELNEYINMLETLGDIVVEDIQNQQYLKSAEADNLLLNIREHDAREIVESVRRQIMYHPVASKLNIEVRFESGDFRLRTDGALLKRILLNMAKNAAEASSEQSTILITAYYTSNHGIFTVNNQGVIPEEVQHQIFQRSFSTKGHGRGLGTYSMKLFGENYLKGKVSFTSERESGTTFMIEIPL